MKPARLLPANALADLQRAAGNGTVVAALRSGAPGVSTDREAEEQADRIADAAVARMGAAAGLPPVTGGSLSPVLQRALAAAAPRLGRLDDVRVRTGADAAADVERIGARAFASADGISVARGELGRGVESTRLLAHEAVHAGMHVPGDRSDLVHAKLRGTRAAAIQSGGGKSFVLRRALFKTNWDRILDGLGAYEEQEAKLLAGGNPSPAVLAAAKPQLLATLARIEAAILAWQKANDEEGQTAQTELLHKKSVEEGSASDTDVRTKAARRQTVALLLTRVRTEMADLNSGRWSSTLGLSDAQVVSKGREDAGQLNKVAELNYVTESGPFSGFFKQEKGWMQSSDIVGHDAESGIRQADPQFGARAMAMYRLDQLLQAGVTARVEFAVHEVVDENGRKALKLGTVLESAKGTRAAETKTAINEPGKGDSVSLSDPTLQRCLNKLQILDAIAGQLDRHQGNYFIQHEHGKVTGVTGIDLDMSFGRDFTDPTKPPRSAAHYTGIPKEIDAEFGRRILGIKEEAVREALTGLLPEPELKATLSRFRVVKEKIAEADKAGLLRSDWGGQTALAATNVKDPSILGRKGESTSYMQALAGGSIAEAAAAARATASKALDFQVTLGKFHPEVIDALKPLLVHSTKWDPGVIGRLVMSALASGRLAGGDVELAVKDLVDELMAAIGDEWATAGIDGSYDKVAPKVAPTAQRLWPRVVARYRRTKVTVGASRVGART